MDLGNSLEAEEGPLTSLDGGDFPSKLKFHLSFGAEEVASPLEVSVFVSYVLCFVVVIVYVGVIVNYSTRGARILCFYLVLQNLEDAQMTRYAKVN